MNFRNAVCALVAMVTLSGCSTTITNLTPSSSPRTPDNLYPLEVALETTQSTIRENSMRPVVVIGTETFPMRPVQKLKNRWEAAVPIPAATNYIYYRYKFDYDYDKVAGAGKSSRLSPTYQLEIVDK